MRLDRAFAVLIILTLIASALFPSGALGATWLDVSLEIVPGTCGPASAVNIQGIVNVDGDPGTPAKGAAIGIAINNTAGYYQEYNVSTDSSGHYSLPITAPVDPGTYMVNVTAFKDPLYGWNQSYLIILQPRPDLAIVGGVQLSNSNPVEQEKVTITCNLTNQGKVSGTANLTFYDGDPGVRGVLLQSQNVSLAPDGDMSVQIIWNPGPGPHTIFAIIEDPYPDDSDLSNNEAWVQVDVQDTTKPQINSVLISPPEPASDVNISFMLNVTDNYGLAKQNAVMFSFTLDNGTAQSINATSLSQGMFQVMLGPYPANTVINYWIEATDLYGNVNQTLPELLIINYASLDITLAPFRDGYEQDSILEFNGFVLMDGQVPVVNGDVSVTILSMEDDWSTITDSQGRFSIKVTTPSTGGNHTLFVTVMSGSLANTVNATFRVLDDAPDLLVNQTCIELSDSSPRVSQEVFLNITVHNVGKADCLAYITIFAESQAGVRTDIELFSELIKAGESAELSVSWFPETQGLYQLTVSTWTPDERLLDNNNATISAYASNPSSENNKRTSLSLTINLILAIALVITGYSLYISRKKEGKP